MTDEAQSPEWPVVCHGCGAQLTPGKGSFYVVRIEAMADPTPPPLDRDRPIGDIAAEIDQLVRRMETQSEQELIDQVYRRLTMLLCTACYQPWIEKPI